jgi:hypothetical protein
MKFLTRMSISAGVLSAALVSGHGWSWYGNDEFTLTATVAEIEFGNPHDRLVVEADGKQWTLLLSPPNRSRNAGLTDEVIHVGDTITAFGHRRESGDTFEVKTERLQVGETLYNLYPDRS